MKLSCLHADTCLPDYWSGHHLAHVQVPVHHGMTHKALISSLHSEVSMGAIAGSEPLTRDDSGEEGDKWYKAAHAAINRIRFNSRARLFKDLDKVEDDNDCSESVYAFFVFDNEVQP